MRVQLPFPRAPVLIFRCIFSCLLEKLQSHITLPWGWGQRCPAKKKTKSPSPRAFSPLALKLSLHTALLGCHDK